MIEGERHIVVCEHRLMANKKKDTYGRSTFYSQKVLDLAFQEPFSTLLADLCRLFHGISGVKILRGFRKLLKEENILLCIR